MKPPFSSRVFALFCAVSLLSFAPARATSVIAPSFDDLVTKAECVITGDVTGLRSEWTGEGQQRHIVTYVTLNVLRTLKGEVASALTLRVFGGTVGTDTMEVADAPTFRVGERQILFVRNNGRQFIPLVGIMHGQYRVTDSDQIADHAGRPLLRVEDIGAPETLEAALRRRATTATRNGPGAPAALSRAEFEAKITAKVESQYATAH